MANVNWSVVGVIAVVLAIVGATTYLGAAGVVAGSTVIQVFMGVLGGLGVLGGGHAASNAISKASAPK